MLHINHPNPFNQYTTIAFSTMKSDWVNLEVYNSLGEKVAVLVDEILPAGLHSVVFNAVGLPSGIYVVSMTFASDNFSELMKINILK